MELPRGGSSAMAPLPSGVGEHPCSAEQSLGQCLLVEKMDTMACAGH